MSKNCSKTKGYQCGRTCISVRYICRKDGLSGQSVDIANKLRDMVKSVVTPTFAPKKSWTYETEGEDRKILSKLGGHQLEARFNKLNGKTILVTFKVDRSYHQNDNIDKRTRKRIGLRMLKMMQDGFENSKEGSLFEASAYNEDGRGKAREKLYKKYGFSEPDQRGTMLAIKKNGKIRPPTEEEIAPLFSENEVEMLELMLEILFG